MAIKKDFPDFKIRADSDKVVELIKSLGYDSAYVVMGITYEVNNEGLRYSAATRVVGDNKTIRQAMGYSLRQYFGLIDKIKLLFNL